MTEEARKSNIKFIREAIKDEHLTQVWLINQLELRGIRTQRPTMTSILSGVERGPKTDKIILKSVEILNDYRKKFTAGAVVE